MNSKEWYLCNKVGALLDHCADTTSERKLRLFACGIARHFLDEVSPEVADSIIKGEQYAEGLISKEELGSIRSRVWCMGHDYFNLNYHVNWVVAYTGKNAAYYISGGLKEILPSDDHPVLLAMPDLLRDIINNPYDPVTLPLRYVSETVQGIADEAYYDRLENGQLNPDNLAVLSDALEDEGCPSDSQVLRNLRNPMSHFPGMWALDLVLGKE